jgi:hypothetical protein
VTLFQEKAFIGKMLSKIMKFMKNGSGCYEKTVEMKNEGDSIAMLPNART